MDPLVMLYDEDCGLCRWGADRLQRFDATGTIRVAGIQSVEGRRLLQDVDPQTRLDSWQVVAAEGGVWSAGAAVPVIARRLRGGWAIAWLAETFPDTTEQLYRLIVRHRGQIGRLLGARACAVDPSVRG